VADAQPTDQEIDLGVRLLEAGDDAAFSFLGIQAERLEIDQKRSAKGQSLPPWSNDDAVAKVLEGQRASKEELLRYLNKGMAFARILIDQLEGQLRGILCDGTAVRKEITDLQGDAKEVIKYVVPLVIGALLPTLPITIAVTSIATTIAVILIKRNLTKFCAIGANVVA
jgi:hypothetical protein